MAAWLATAGAVAPLAGQAQFVPRLPLAIALAFPLATAAGDFDGDGDADVLVRAGQLLGGPAWRVLRNDGAELFTDVTATSLPSQPPSGTTALARVLAFDADGDQDADVLTSVMGTATLLRNAGNGTFSLVPLPSSGGFTDLAAADLDLDGDLDVAASGNVLTGSTHRVFVNLGTGFTTSPLPASGSAAAIAALDFDGDGDLDLLHGGNDLVALRNDGGLVFTDVTATWAAGLVPGYPRDIAAGDVDGDGDPDVIVARQGVAVDAVLVNTGSTFVLAALLPTGTNGTEQCSLVDTDDDGDRDLLRAGTFGVTLARNDGSGTFTPAPAAVLPLGTTVASLTTADFDRDGDVDVLAADFQAVPGLLWNRHRELRPGQPVLGQAWAIEVWSQPGYAAQSHLAHCGIALHRLPQPLPLGPFGELWLDPATALPPLVAVVPANTGVATFSIVVPNIPALAGLEVHVQALVEPASALPHLTAHSSVTVQ
jgi:hypothetical protein